MSIKGDVTELVQIQTEIKRNNTRNKELRHRIKQLETNITEYLDQKGHRGVRYNGRAIVLENKERRPPKKKKEKETDVVELLKRLGVEDAQNAYIQIIEAQKGDPVEQQKIKFEKIKDH